MKLSVIIPVFNEEEALGPTLNSLLAHNPDEVILADGGSSDKTEVIARNFPVKWIRAAKGRAAQMNAGAEAATGDVLLFLHADTVLPKGAAESIRQVIKDGAIGGRFRVSFDQPSFKYKAIAWYTRFKCFSYGDQGFFVQKHVFERLNGYNIKIVFEDVDFYRRLRREGKTVILADAVKTSARRFQKIGFLKQKMINIILSTVECCGGDPRPLIKRWYGDIR